MTRSEVNEAMARFFADGGKVTKLPDGPDFRFQPYGVRVKENMTEPKIDLTALEDPANKKQEKVVEADSA
tara:strand:+ start:80 stop:289 length:210 start_codon:yes stop_codon:yes gene_type:complete